MKLREAPFRAIKEGRKDIELRLYDEKRKKLAVGDTVVFTCTESEEHLYATVKALHPFPNFQAIYAAFPKERFGYGADETADPRDMLAYYPEEEIRRCGVLGIELVLRSAPPLGYD